MSATVNPATYGQTRATWRTQPVRVMIAALVEQHPDASQEDLRKLFVERATERPDVVEDALGIAFDNNYRAFTRTPPAPPQPIPATVIAEATQRLKRAVLMEYMLPGGTALRDATADDCFRVGGWLTAVGAKVGGNMRVGNALTEDELHELFEAAQ